MFGDHPAELINLSGDRPHTHLASYGVRGAAIFFFDCLNARLRSIATTQGILAFSADPLLFIFFAKC
jgi:hypothetical protein